MLRHVPVSFEAIQFERLDRANTNSHEFIAWTVFNFYCDLISIMFV